MRLTISAYFNTKITVNILKNELSSRTADSVIFDREVDLQRDDKEVSLLCLFYEICCHASSTITIQDEHILFLITEQNVGIGQLFRYLNILPEFQLINLGRSEEVFWREYYLKSPGIECRIKEVFPQHMFYPTL